MSWLSFIAEMTKAVAWPIAIVVAAWIFRDPLLKLLHELKRLKWRDVELEFEKEILKAKAELPNIQLRKNDVGHVIGDMDIESKLLNLLEISPKAAVLEAWLNIEREVSDLLKRKNVELEPGLSRLGLMQLLINCKLIDKKGRELLDTVRKLRNRAANEHETEISENAALDYIEMASEMIRILRSA